MHLPSATNTPLKSNNLSLSSPSPVKLDKCLSRIPPRAILPRVVAAGSVGGAPEPGQMVRQRPQQAAGSEVGGRGGSR